MGVVSQQPSGRPDSNLGSGLLGASGTPWLEAAGLDPVNTYFECITACSVDDGECVTRCVEVLREGD